MKLIERLEAATEGSRELDYLIHCALGWIDHDQGGWTRGDETAGEGWPLYTSSLDAALPGETIRMVEWADAYDADGNVTGKHWTAFHFCDNGDVYAGSHPTSEALARRIAILRAKEREL